MFCSMLEISVPIYCISDTQTEVVGRFFQFCFLVFFYSSTIDARFKKNKKI